MAPSSNLLSYQNHQVHGSSSKRNHQNKFWAQTAPTMLNIEAHRICRGMNKWEFTLCCLRQKKRTSRKICNRQSMREDTTTSTQLKATAYQLLSHLTRINTCLAHKFSTTISVWVPLSTAIQIWYKAATNNSYQKAAARLRNQDQSRGTNQNRKRNKNLKGNQ